jgi:hypothetical protein
VHVSIRVQPELSIHQQVSNHAFSKHAPLSMFVDCRSGEHTAAVVGLRDIANQLFHVPSLFSLEKTTVGHMHFNY